MTQGAVIWFTGHSKSGKTTLTKLINKELELKGYRSICLDSDTLPTAIIKPNADTWQERQKLKNENLVFLSELLYNRGDIVLIASVGRLRHFREELKTKVPSVIQIYLKCPLEERLRRDHSGKYETHKDYFHFYEEPNHPDLILETDKQSVQECVNQIMSLIRQKGFID